MAKSNRTAVTKKIFFIYVSEDIDNAVKWSLKRDFTSLIVVKPYKTAGSLYKALQENECHLLILDSLLVESVEEYVKKVRDAVPTIKTLIITQANAPDAEVNELTSIESVVGVVMRPFTPDQLNGCLYETFGFKKSVEMNIFNIKKGMVVAADVFSATSKDPIVYAGEVLDEEAIKHLMNSNVQRITVHSETSSFLNCWEVRNCGNLGKCPATAFLDADGFLGGINAGRGCMFVRNTLVELDKIKDQPFSVKVKELCGKCEFCKLVAFESRGTVSHATFVDHIKRNKDKKKTSDLTILTDEKPKHN
jgi:hypothetical protein